MDTVARSLADRLRELATNLWWTWQPDVIAVFRDLDPELWRRVNHNPAAFVTALPAEQLARRAEETVLDARINWAFHRLEDYLHDKRTWGGLTCGVLHVRPVAYFSAEFALHESLPIYSGGLGGLAGDHLKAASDLGVPLVGVGLFYGEGYFRQRMDAEGWQREEYGATAIADLPLRRAVASDGTPLVVDVPLDNGRVRVAAWRAEVGRATLVLLDTNHADNTPELRAITAQLYGGDQRVRLRQELVLGVGGIRMLTAVGIEPGVLHMNEGHTAFAALELARGRAEAEGSELAVALRDVAQQTVFTTHTPVPAGHDTFAPDLVLEHLGWLVRERGITPEALLALGRVDAQDAAERFCMTVLGLRSARYANAVSALHGRVTRRMWQRLWPDRPETDVPIGHITNGVHVPSWLAPQVATGYQSYLGRTWRERLARPDAAPTVVAIDDVAIWEIHQVLKRQMLAFVARRAGSSEVLDRDVLTLTFARRFAEYKRPALLFTDLDRLVRLVTGPGRGLQLVFAGKAHPRDDDGKRLLQRIVRTAGDPRLLGRITFVEDYDFSVARHLVQGSDVWLNTPRRPLEACGTSGQKALFNGALHCSTLDGWWAEAYDGTNGFAIGAGLAHANPAVQDARDAADLYRVLEDEIVPLYYERDADGVPRRWVARMKRAVLTLGGRFDAERMVRDYVLGCYLPAAGGVSALAAR